MMTLETDGRRLRGERAREKILAQAIIIASTEGLEGLTIGKLATQAGISKGNITVLFKNKEWLQLAVLNHAMDQFKKIVIDPVEQQADPVLRLTDWIGAWFDLVENRRFPGGCFLTTVSNEYRMKPGPIRDQILAYRILRHKRLAKWIKEAKENKQLPERLDAKQLIFELISYQASANVAFMMAEPELFYHARTRSLQIISELSQTANH